MSKTWTPERRQMVKEMLVEGLTGKQIADRLGNGITRNAVIGFVHRNADLRAIGFKGAPSEHSGAMAARAERVSVAAQRKKNVRDNMAPKNRINDAPTLPDVPGRFGGPHVAGVDLTMLTEHRCKWPINDGGPFLFCGEAKKSDRPYCAFHAQASIGKALKANARRFGLRSRSRHRRPACRRWWRRWR